MQSTASRTPILRSEHRIGAVIIALIVILAVGAIISADRDAGSVVVSRPDGLPETTVNRPVSFEQTRFMEMNTLLPESPKVPVSPIERRQMIESYRRPEVVPVLQLSAAQRRLFEINMLPGDDTPLLAPVSDERGVPH